MTNWNWPELIEEQKQSGKTISVNSGEKVPHFNGLKVPLLGKIKQDQRSLFSTGLSSGMNPL